MLRASLFWGMMLILVGVLLGLQTAGIIAGDIWGYIWGLFLLGAGVWLISNAFYNPASRRAGSGISIDRKDAGRANIRFEYGAGSLVVRGGAPMDKVIEGSSGVAMDVKVSYVADEARVKVSTGPSWIPFLGPDEGTWVFQLNEEIPLDIRVACGASSANLDLTGVKAHSVRFETGASSVKLLLPEAAGETRVEIEGGASSFDVTLPPGVEGRVNIRQGASAINLDEARFAQVGMNQYETAGYASAANRADIVLNTGAARINIR
jgi:hypothetical protein